MLVFFQASAGVLTSGYHRVPPSAQPSLLYTLSASKKSPGFNSTVEGEVWRTPTSSSLNESKPGELYDAGAFDAFQGGGFDVNNVHTMGGPFVSTSTSYNAGGVVDANSKGKTFSSPTTHSSPLLPSVDLPTHETKRNSAPSFQKPFW